MPRPPSVEQLALVKVASRLGTESEPPLAALREVEKYLEERHTQSAPVQLERTPPSPAPSSLEELPEVAEEDRGREEWQRDRDKQEASARQEQEERDREGRYYSSVEQTREEPTFLPMGSVGAALPSPYNYRPPDRSQQASNYSFDPWSPVLASSSLQQAPSSSLYSPPGPYDLYAATPSSPYSYPRELIWSRTQQEQQLALQQRQQREQLHLQLQQQDERYQQEAHQRQQQESLRLQQSSYGSYPGLSFPPPTPRPPSYPPPSSHLYGVPLPSSAEPIIPQASRARETYDESPRQRESQPPRGLDRALNPGEQSRDAGYEQRTTYYDEEGMAIARGGSTGMSHRYFEEKGSPPAQGFGQRDWPSSREEWSRGQQLRSPPQQPSVPPYPQQQHQRPKLQQRMPSSEMDLRLNDPRRTHILSSPPPRPHPDLPPHQTHAPPHHSSAPVPSLPAPPPPAHPASVPLAPALLPHPPLPSLIAPPPLTAPSHAHLKPDRTAGETLRSGLPLVPDRSPWAMWAGNIPADATHEELWEFFSNRSGPGGEGEKAGFELEGEVDPMRSAGVESIHLIGRSNCAFINYLTSAHLQHAINTCTGLLLRPTDRRCKPLLCRVRMREDDAKSGVGAQRGSGMHKKYVEEMGREEENGSDEESTASTASSLFARHFPKRFFILKSHSNEELETSVRTGLWRTQPHNEAVLDQAYRTARDGVFLIFSVNKSREWFGYAKMAGPVPPTGEGGVSWSPSSTGLTMPSMTGSISSRSDVASPENLRVDRGTAEEASSSAVDEGSQQLPEVRGRPFRVDWIKVQRLPFVRTRHIFNSFNQNREIKISRDGTEIEPIAGEQLLREFWLMKPKPPSAPRSRRPLRSSLPPSDSSVGSQAPQQLPESFGRRT